MGQLLPMQLRMMKMKISNHLNLQEDQDLQADQDHHQEDDQDHQQEDHNLLWPRMSALGGF